MTLRALAKRMSEIVEQNDADNKSEINDLEIVFRVRGATWKTTKYYPIGSIVNRFPLLMGSRKMMLLQGQVKEEFKQDEPSSWTGGYEIV